MTDIGALFERLDRDQDTVGLRLDIADAIARSLIETRNSFGYWEKAHLAQAIAALAWNINIGDRDTRSWLRLCLVNLELAHVPEDERSEDYAQRDGQVETLTFEQLMDDIQRLGARE